MLIYFRLYPIGRHTGRDGVLEQYSPNTSFLGASILQPQGWSMTFLGDSTLKQWTERALASSDWDITEEERRFKPNMKLSTLKNYIYFHGSNGKGMPWFYIIPTLLASLLNFMTMCSQSLLKFRTLIRFSAFGIGLYQ